MVPRQVQLRQMTPWVVSGASGVYIMKRARKLSQAEPSDASLARFLVDQSDLILLLVGNQAIWHMTRRPRRLHPSRSGPQATLGPAARAIHQLRQVFTALTIGAELLVRRAARGRTSELVTLAMRLHKIVHDGTEALAVLDQVYQADLIHSNGMDYPRTPASNGRRA